VIQSVRGASAKFPHFAFRAVERGSTSTFPFFPVLLLNPARQHSERFVSAPAVDSEILVQRQNIRGPKLIRQANQARICKIDRPVAVFSHYQLDSSRFMRKLKGNLENAGGDVFDNRIWCAGQVSQQVATLCNDGFASDQRCFQFSNRSSAHLVETLAAIEQRNDETCVE
jgi:hypothetical protein